MLLLLFAPGRGRFRGICYSGISPSPVPARTSWSYGPVVFVILQLLSVLFGCIAHIRLVFLQFTTPSAAPPIGWPNPVPGCTTPSPRFQSGRNAFEGVPFRHGVNDPFGLFFVPQGGGDPNVFEGVGELAEHVPYITQTFGEELMDPVLHGTPVAHVVDQDFGSQLPDSLNSPFALFQPGRIPGKVQIDEGPRTLEVEPFRRASPTWPPARSEHPGD